MTKKKTGYNKGFAIGGASYSADTFVQGGSSVLRMKFSAKTPPIASPSNVSRYFMKGQHKYILTIILTIILCSAMTVEKQFNEYQGGRFGYSGVTLKLYSDSTYYYSEWNHIGRSIKDNGKWGRIYDHYYLTSKSKTRWIGRNGKSDKIFRFETQEFFITSDTIKFIPKDAKDNDYFDAYYKLCKVMNTKK